MQYIFFIHTYCENIYSPAQDGNVEMRVGVKQKSRHDQVDHSSRQKYLGQIHDDETYLVLLFSSRMRYN